MTAATKRKARDAFLRDQLARARTDALDVAGDFRRLCEVHPSRLNLRSLAEVTYRVGMKAAEVRIAVFACKYHRVRP
jgi:hypothetical protein